MRLSWVDAVKGFAIIGVVFGHVEAGYLGRNMYPEFTFLLQALWDMGHVFRMPLFFMISGYLYEITWNEKYTFVDWHKMVRKFCDIGTLYIVFGVLFWMVKYASGIYIQRGITDVQMVSITTIQDLLLLPVKPYSYLWFLWVLAILFLVVPELVKHFSNRKFIVGMFTIGYLLPWDNIALLRDINWGGK